jgi:hypothetical protein
MNFETFGYVSCRGGQALAETAVVCEGEAMILPAEKQRWLT